MSMEAHIAVHIELQKGENSPQNSKIYLSQLRAGEDTQVKVIQFFALARAELSRVIAFLVPLPFDEECQTRCTQTSYLPFQIMFHRAISRPTLRRCKRQV